MVALTLASATKKCRVQLRGSLILMQICWYYSRLVKVASDGLIVSSTKLVLYLGFGVRKESVPP